MTRKSNITSASAGRKKSDGIAQSHSKPRHEKVDLTIPSNPSGALWRWLIVFGLLGTLVVGLVVFRVGIARSHGKPRHEKVDLTIPSDDEFVSAEEQQKKRDEFASDRGGNKKDAVKPVKIDAKRTMGYLDAICKIGPRMSGTEGMKKQQKLIEKHFEDLGGKVTYQKFTAKQRSVGKAIDMANMVVSYHPDRARRVILCSHYDTRPLADQEPDERNWTKSFVSANDGGSGVALMMELAHHVKDLETSVGIDFVFFDGEEYVFDKDDLYFFGSKHFAKEYAKIKKKTTYTGAILLDMVGGKGAKFPIERASWLKASKLVREVWGIAAELKCDRFKTNLRDYEIQDDHIPLNQGGIPAIDVIDFDYAHWHRLTDVPKNCAPEPLDQVARVVSVWIQRQK